ncbi:hypothetical protein [Streptomyces sp. NRRL WC-3549]|uniref:hypothetical protein n=1 Tax=Streptomyces sp. NRRL WC-3549 TaxID=1463925 RepID=UPI00068D4BD2|nr:hypothetical protein [Streptomyces sp. NRRL WC-3549]
MRAFLGTGYRLAQAQHDRVAAARLLSDPALPPALRAAARTILTASDPEEVRWFLEVGQYEIIDCCFVTGSRPSVRTRLRPEPDAAEDVRAPSRGA